MQTTPEEVSSAICECRSLSAQIRAILILGIRFLRPMSSQSATDLQARLTRALGASQTRSEEISMAAFRELTLEQQGTYLITFGKTHRGRSYADIWEKEPGYVKWFQATYHASTKSEHQRFLHYVTRQVEHFEETAPSHQVTPMSAPKSKAYPKPKPAPAQMPVTAQDLADLNAEESWEPVELEEETHPVYADVAALQDRMMYLETALQEVIGHLRSSAQSG